MGKAECLEEASSDGVLHAERPPVKKCREKPEVSPVIVVADPKYLLVKKPYQTKGHRLALRLGTDKKFTGTGTLKSSPAGQIEVYDSKGVLQNLPLQIPGAKLSKGVKLYLQAVTPSADLHSTAVSLSLAGGDKTIVKNPAVAALTCVEVQLDLCKYKPAPGGPDPAAVADKINVGRNLHLQTTDLGAGRALMIVQKAKPNSYAGSLVLKARNVRGAVAVKAFDYTEERPVIGQTAQPNPLKAPNRPITPGGLKLWVEGVKASAKPLDTGFTLGISDLPGVEGDRVNITVVQAILAVYAMPEKAGSEPKRIPDASKLNPGRSLHLQDAGNNHGRAKTVVKRVAPSTWDGDLELQVWDITADSSANPRLKLFEGPAAGSAQHANPIKHSAAFPKTGKALWVEGILTSGALKDTELRLKVADAEGIADRGRFTVHELFAREVKFHGIADIYYARIPSAGSYILTPPAEPPKTHLTPVEVRPAAGTAHWGKKPAKDPAAAFSWPAVYARKKAAGVPSPTLEATLELYPKSPGTVTARIKADSGASKLKTNEKKVTFNGGDAAGISFELKGLPNTATLLNGIEFQWYFDGPAHKTKHTLFVVDMKPRAANNGFADEYLWEVFEWSCRWADGRKGSKNVYAAIWGKFKPVAAAHDTGLVYWKNWTLGVAPAQDLVTAIQSQDPPTPAAQQNAASCKVFAQVLMNCAAAHGIASGEIVLEPPSGTFTRTAITYTCNGWHDTTTVGQGNPAAPPDWGNHWIAVLKRAGWKFYDPSYGDGPTKASTPGAAISTIDVMSFEPRTVASFNCINVAAGTPASVSRDPNPARPPHLVGSVLWTNK